MYVFIYSFIYLCLFIFGLFLVCTFSSTIVISGPLSIFQALCQYSKILVYICVSKIFSSTTFIQALCRYSKILVYTCVSTILALELLFQALRQYSNILAYRCVSTILSSRTVIL